MKKAFICQTPDPDETSNVNNVFWSPCPENWVLIKQKCFHVNTTTTLAFDEAVAYCAEQGGSLFEPTYNGEDQAVATWASGIFQEAFWLGITDNAVEGE